MQPINEDAVRFTKVISDILKLGITQYNKQYSSLVAPKPLKASKIPSSEISPQNMLPYITDLIRRLEEWEKRDDNRKIDHDNDYKVLSQGLKNLSIKVKDMEESLGKISQAE